MPELVRARGTDFREYSVVPAVWSLEKVESYWGVIKEFGIYSDDMPQDSIGFLKFVLGAGALWFEIVDLEYEQVIGLMYLTDLIAGADDQFVEASWHAMVFDAKATPRRPVLKAAIREVFRQFGLHRLRAEIPLQFGGTIRQAKKIGFIPEGRLREARRYNGVYFDSLILSLLRSEVQQWATP